MRVLVFAHVPPPFHGQSYMVQMMLENLGGTDPTMNPDLTFFHVDARLSDDLSDIGTWRPGKFFRLAGYIFQAWKMRWNHSIDAFYYIPAPPAKRGALYRDWAVLGLVSFLFKNRIFHWHGVGLGEWIREGLSAGILRRIEARITQKLYSGHALSCVLSEWGRSDVEIFSPAHTTVIANCAPNTCANFTSTVLPERQRRSRQLHQGTEKSPALFNLLYLALATRSKGLFDSVEAVAVANARLAREKQGWRVRLTIAGSFCDHKEEAAFNERISHEDLRLPDGSCAVVYLGYVDSKTKDSLLRNSDALCFASFYPIEGQPVSIIEALAYGLPVILSRWRALPEMVPPALAHLVDPGDATGLANAMIEMAQEDRFEAYRNHFAANYMVATYCERLHDAFLSIPS